MTESFENVSDVDLVRNYKAAIRSSEKLLANLRGQFPDNPEKYREIVDAVIKVLDNIRAEIRRRELPMI